MEDLLTGELDGLADQVVDEEGGGAPSLSPEDEAIDEFADLVQAGDREGAREAFKAAVKLCMRAAKKGERDY